MRARNISTDEEFRKKIARTFKDPKERTAVQKTVFRFSNVAGQDKTLECLTLAHQDNKLEDAIMEILVAWEMFFILEKYDVQGDPETSKASALRWKEVYARLGIENPV